MAITKWTSLSSLNFSRIFKLDICPSTITEIFGRMRVPSHSRSLTPGYFDSRSSIASRTVEPVTTTKVFPCARSRKGAGMNSVGIKHLPQGHGENRENPFIGLCKLRDPVTTSFHFFRLSIIFAGDMGKFVTLTPTALCIAFAIAPGGGTMHTSPTPFAPKG